MTSNPRVRPRLPYWAHELFLRPTGAFGATVLFLLLASALVSLFWTPHPLLQANPDQAWLGPSSQHWLGTDQIGRDTFSWLLAGSRTAVLVVTFSTLLAAVIGTTFGALSALAPRRVGAPVAVLVDIFIAFPVLLLAMLLAAPFGGSIGVVVIAVGIGYGMNIGRVTRPEILRISQSDFMLASRASGVGTVRSILRHIVPNVGPIFIVQLSMVAATSLLAEAGLSYLGYGAPSTTPSWGRTLATSQQLIGVQPLSVLWPGLTITLTVLALTLLGDALREAVDPRLKRSALRVPSDAETHPALAPLPDAPVLAMTASEISR